MAEKTTKAKSKPKKGKEKKEKKKAQNKPSSQTLEKIAAMHGHDQAHASEHQISADEAEQVHEKNKFREGYEEHGANYQGVRVEKDREARYRNHSERQAEQKGKAHYEWNWGNEHDITQRMRTSHEHSMKRRGVKEGALEAKLKRMKCAASNKEEYERLIEQYRAYLKENGIEEPTYGERFKTFLHTLGLMGQNAIDISIGKYLVDHHNEETLHELHKGDRVLIYLHVMWENGGAFGTAIAQAEKAGYKALAPSYDFNDTHERATATIEPWIQQVWKKTGVKHIVVGHSMGANNLEYGLKEKGWGNIVGEAVLSQGATMGVSHSTFQQQLVTSLFDEPKTASSETEEGRAIALNFAYKPFPVRTHIITGTGDRLIGNPVYSMSPNAQSFTAVVGAPHFSGAGGDPIYNKVVLDRLAKGSKAGEGGEILNIPVYERII